MKTLGVTSPLTRGPDVKAAQQRLNGGNVFKTDWLQGPVDSVFGELSGQACRRSKWWVGYPEKEITDDGTGPVYGDKLDGFLSGRTKLPVLYARRRAARLKAAQAKPLRVKALEQARRYIGQKENPPGSNRIPFASGWYGVIGPWCAMAVTRWYVDAGSKAFVRGSRYAYCPYIVHDARAGRNGLSVTKDPQPGDLVLFDWQGNGVADHIGVFDHWVRKGRDFKTVEGNTAVGNDSNGGEVMSRTRELGAVQCFVRVGR